MGNNLSLFDMSGLLSRVATTIKREGKYPTTLYYSTVLQAYTGDL